MYVILSVTDYEPVARYTPKETPRTTLGIPLVYTRVTPGVWTVNLNLGFKKPPPYPPHVQTKN